jgi:hypothetical protein
MESYLAFFDNSIWSSGYPIGIAILIVWWIVARFNR